MRRADRSLERNLIGPKRITERDSPVLSRLIDLFSKNPLELTILHFLLAACMWVVSDDQSISYANELGNSFENTLKLSTPIAYDCLKGVETCEKALDELY